MKCERWKNTQQILQAYLLAGPDKCVEVPTIPVGESGCQELLFFSDLLIRQRFRIIRRWSYRRGHDLFRSPLCIFHAHFRLSYRGICLIVGLASLPFHFCSTVKLMNLQIPPTKVQVGGWNGPRCNPYVYFLPLHHTPKRMAPDAILIRRSSLIPLSPYFTNVAMFQLLCS